MPWVIFLAITLPKHASFRHYRGVWVGFDIGLIFVLALTAYLATRRRPGVALAATATSTMLFVDAWFDVGTSRGTSFIFALLLAGVVELPLAVICLWIALHAEQVVESRLIILARRADRTTLREAEEMTGSSVGRPAQVAGRSSPVADR